MANRFLSNVKINDAYTFPASDGTNGQVITTDGAGNLSFQSAGEAGATVIYKDLFTGNASTVVFTLANSVDNEVKTQVYFDGVYQSKENYTVSGNAITFSTAPPSGAAIEVITFATVAAADYNQKLNFYGKAVGTIAKGDAVMFAGAQGDHFLITKATQAGLDANHEYFLGLAAHDFVNNQYGYVTQFGRLEAMDTSNYIAGDILWFDSAGTVAGALTTTPPSAPNTKIQIAAVVRVHQNEGVIFVRPTVYHEMSELHDVSITSAADKDLLSWNATLGVWENTKTLGNITTGNITTSGTVDGVDVSLFKSDYDTHNHDSRYYTETEIDTLLTNKNNWDTAYSWGDHSLVGYLTSFTETDPVFSASPSAGITSTQITNWNTAYGWGDHSAQSYATQTYVGNAIAGLIDSAPATLDTLNELAAALGDDPNFATTVSNSIGLKWTQDNVKISNWDTAYGWGNHAGLYSLLGHTHDDRYYTETESDARFAPISHTHPYLPLTGGTLTGGITVTASEGREVSTYLPSSYTTDDLVSGHEYGWYDDHWRLGMTRSGNSAGADFVVQWNGSRRLSLTNGGNLTVTGTLSATGYNKSNWDTAYGWGNHAGLYQPLNSTLSRFSDSSWAGTSGYPGYTFVGGNSRIGFSSTAGVVDVYADGNFYATDSSFRVWHAGDFSSTNISNWNTAYGWGNHAGLYASVNHTHIISPISETAVPSAGISIQAGPGSNNTQGWAYPYGTRLSVITSAARSFEIMSTTYPNGELVMRTLDGSNVWDAWKTIIDSSNIGSQSVSYASNAGTLDSIDSSQFLRSDAADSWSQLLTYNGSGNGLQVGGIRGTFGGVELIHLYNRVHIGTPAGWGAQGAPDYGLSTYGGVDLAVNQGYTTSGGSMRAPIFYDSNDTNYYVDPNGSSILNGTVVIKGNDNQLAIDGTNGALASGLFFRESGINKYELYHYSGEFRFYNYTTNQQEMSINNVGGYVTSRTSFRSPIFYDSNDTGYYVDPASRSVLSEATIEHGINLRRDLGADSGISFYTPSYYNWQIYMSPAGATGAGANANLTAPSGLSAVTNWALRSRMEGVSTYGWLWEVGGSGGGGATASSVMELSIGGDLTLASSVRAPILYDSNNTAYYTDPAGGSIFNVVQANGAIKSSRFEDNGGSFIYQTGTNTGTSRHINLADTTLDPSVALGTGISWGQRTDGNPYYIIRTIQENYNGNYTKLDISWHTGIKIGAASTYGGTRFYNNSTYLGSEIMRVGTANNDVYINYIGEAGSSLRAPIFYDSNDTTYYTNPNGTSRFRDLWVRGDNQYQGYVMVGGDSAGARLNINFDQMWTSVGNLHLQYSSSGNIDMNQGGGYTFSRTSLRAPIFYDYDDTAYYVDANSTSNLARLQILKNNVGTDIGSACIYLDNASGSNGTTYNMMSDVSTYFGSRHIGFLYNGTVVGHINAQSTTSVAYNTTSSDLRLKTNIEPWIENTLEKFENIEPKLFNFNFQEEGEDKDKGFIAQDMVDKFPEAYPHDCSMEDGCAGYYSFNPSGMVIYLMKALKEQTDLNKSFAATIEDLKTRIQTLENGIN